jgi:DUF3037 family protein
MDVKMSPPGEREERMYLYRIIRYAPSLVRDEWLNIGVLLFDPETGDRRLQMISETQEYARVRRLHPEADEALLRRVQDDLESRFDEFSTRLGNEGGSERHSGHGVTRADNTAGWQELLTKWDNLLSNTLQLTESKALLSAKGFAFEMDRLYGDHVALPPRPGRAPESRATLRDYCTQVFHQAQVWKLVDRRVPVSPYTFPGDPMHIDYSYRRNGTRGFVQTLSVTRSPGDAKMLAYTAEHIARKSELGTEFAAVTDVPLLPTNPRHRFVSDTLKAANIASVPREGFAVWVAKLKPMLRVQ